MKSVDNFSTMPLRFRVWNKKTREMYSGCTLDETAKIARMIGRENAIISQDTGIKDKNGESIYTGDIIRDVNKGHLLITKYIDGEYMGVDPVEDEVCDSVYYIARDGEVIGSIWQNPELLEEK